MFIKNKNVANTIEKINKKEIYEFIKQFQTNKFINPDNDKYVEDVIQAYWNIQNVKNLIGTINPIQTYIKSLFIKDPLLIDKLYKCKKNFVLQQKKYSDNVKAICKFGKYSMFTTEYDSSIIPPIFSSFSSWGEASGTTTKQLVILIASKDSQWLSSIVSPDDKKYIHGIQKLFEELKTSNLLNYIEDENSVSTIMFTNEVYNNKQSQNRENLDKSRQKQSDKYTLIAGNIFSENQQKSDIKYLFTGILDFCGLINVSCLDIENYRNYLDKFIKSDLIREDNPQLFSYTWSRFESCYEKLLQSFIDRAIIFIHQFMVDFLISIYENIFTVPQLFMFFSPGTMTMHISKNGDTESSMIVSTCVDKKDNQLCIRLDKLKVSPTNKQDTFIYSIETDNFILREKDEALKQVYIFLKPANSRGATVFNYFSISDNEHLMSQSDIEKRLTETIKTLSIYNGNIHFHLNGNVITGKYKYGSYKQEIMSYNGRVIVNLEEIRNLYNDFSDITSTQKYSLNDIIDKISLKNYENTVFLGIPFEKDFLNTKDKQIITADDIYDDVRICLSISTTVPIVILENNIGGKAKVSDMSNIKFDDNILDKIVMDDKRKQFISTIAKVQNKNSFKDIVYGKESGCIFLLSGSPGTGKSLTAEAIAEILHKPLYKISAGGLGSDEYNFEQELSKILTKAIDWNAIILIDEADVYLKKRDDNIKRNTIVSTFLRKLEYYNGIMFLTTNRIDDIDEAFYSRILQIFHFDKLSIKEKNQIWKNLLTNMNVSITDKEIETLSTMCDNGRHIKNIIKASNAIAINDNTPLNYDIIYKTAKYMQKENSFLLNR